MYLLSLLEFNWLERLDYITNVLVGKGAKNEFRFLKKPGKRDAIAEKEEIRGSIEMATRRAVIVRTGESLKENASTAGKSSK